jgi:hypothetical protein
MRRYCLFLVAFTALACQEEKIRHYQVARTETARPQANGGRAPDQMLAAIVPHGERNWFFKLLGPASEVEPHKVAFETLVDSIRFNDAGEPPISWATPEGWAMERGAGLRFATLRLPNRLELTVTALGREAGSVLDNVNRWRGQIGLKPITPAELSQVTTRRAVAGSEVTLVDITSAGDDAPPPPPSAKTKPRFTKPDGWTERAGRGGMTLLAYDVAQGDHKAEVTVMALPGDAGGLLQNVNRWRGQVKLEPTTDAALDKDLRTLEVAGEKVRYADLAGPDERILVVLVPHAGQTWFIKMKGPKALVDQQQKAFETFAGSVTFE